MADSSSEEIELTNGSRFYGYALYTYNANRQNSIDVTVPDIEDPDGTVPQLMKQEAIANHDFGLSLLSTDLTGEQDTELRTFIAKRLAKGTVYSGSGIVAVVDNVMPDGSGCQCYYCLLRGDKEVENDSDEMVDVMNLGGYLSKDFVVCFVADLKLELQLFQLELNKYSLELLPELMTPIESLDVKEQFGHLKDWYQENINCFCRCVKLLDDKLPLLIHCGLSRVNVEVQSTYSQAKKDIELFLEACSTVDVSDNSTLETEGDSSKSSQQVIVNVVDGKCTFSSEATTAFCKEWSETMQSGDTEDPVFLRQVIENYKLRVNHDMNTLKRLLRQAETDHYALYRSYRFLVQSGNGSILLENTKRECQAVSASETLEILNVLEDYNTRAKDKFTLHES
ncbi:protein Njmu-R1 [Nematostella vectensis]|uniref:protein Njmu-R1 n=1 Tax=Nematostella vectensis TaxID=45351 RepID=UPI00138FDE23|nr:protein Njmu-R1 [Nematostella vectensis]